MDGNGKAAEKPFVTALIVVRNEEKYIAKCLGSLLCQDYPSDCYEIVIVDGESTDKTLEIINEEIKKASEERQTPSVRILNNPKHILASGWNIGIKAAQGEYIIRPDAHAYVEKDFISKNVDVMLKVGDASCVGGRMVTVSTTKKGEMIKEALSSPFGVGGAKFRYSKEAGYVDTVAYGLYKKSVFDEIGYFNEALVRTQDNDLHRRMRDAGMKFYLDPEICSYYNSRDTFKKLAKQQFSNGKWTMINFRLRPGKMSLRHFVPLAFVLALIVTLIGGIFFHPIWFLTLGGLLMHLACGLVFAVKRTKKISHILALPWVFLLMHLCYGTGSIVGFFAYYKVKKKAAEQAK
jgi:GT2 family glycosyltransferase